MPPFRVWNGFQNMQRQIDGNQEAEMTKSNRKRPPAERHLAKLRGPRHRKAWGCL